MDQNTPPRAPPHWFLHLLKPVNSIPSTPLQIVTAYFPCPLNLISKTQSLHSYPSPQPDFLISIVFSSDLYLPSCETHSIFSTGTQASFLTIALPQLLTPINMS
ncbi:hypothetical protein MANES_07G072000v8 [Manihot esculenta]|nr:hypothetical protein MANES_07G072000v8 [Manihot esculenta]